MNTNESSPFIFYIETEIFSVIYNFIAILLTFHLFPDDPHEKQNLAASQPEIRDQLFDELQNYIAREVHPLWPPPLEPGGPWQPISESESYTSGWCTFGHLRIIRQQSLGLYDLVASVGHCTYGLLATIVILSAILLMS